MVSKRLVFYLIISLLFLLAAATVQEQSQADLATQVQNPIANMVSLPFQKNINFCTFPDEVELQSVLNIQLADLFSLGHKWNMITLTIVPMARQPDFYTQGEDGVTGLTNHRIRLLSEVFA